MSDSKTSWETERDLEAYMETQRLAVMATSAIEDAMEAAQLSRSQVAERLGISRSRVTKVLEGETNMTLKTLAQFGLACGVVWQFVGVSASDLSDVVTAPVSLELPHPSKTWDRGSEEEVRPDASLERTDDFSLYQMAS
jgi:transcriptional regulator with XRE-family HTH domain